MTATVSHAFLRKMNERRRQQHQAELGRAINIIRQRDLDSRFRKAEGDNLIKESIDRLLYHSRVVGWAAEKAAEIFIVLAIGSAVAWGFYHLGWLWA
jgi:hypothetical protein